MYFPMVRLKGASQLLPGLGSAREALGYKQPAQIVPAGSFEVPPACPSGHHWPDVPDGVGDIVRRPALVVSARREEVS